MQVKLEKCSSQMAPHISSENRLVERVRVVSQRETVELVYEYTIPDFQLLPYKTGESFYTPSFFALSRLNVQWCLLIYPRGNSAASHDHFSVFLVRLFKSNEDVLVAARFKLSIVSNGEEFHSHRAGPYQFGPGQELARGWSKALNPQQLCSVKGQVKIVCHLECEVQRYWISQSAKAVEKATIYHHFQPIPIVELNYEWVVEALDFLPQKTGQNFSSPLFFAIANTLIRWRLVLYPNGVSEESKDYLGLYFERVFVGHDVPVVVKFQVTVTKSNGALFAQSSGLTSVGCQPLPSIWGWNQVGRLEKLKQADSDKEVGNGDLKISCQLVYAI